MIVRAFVRFSTANTWFPFMLLNHWQQLRAHIALPWTLLNFLRLSLLLLFFLSFLKWIETIRKETTWKEIISSELNEQSGCHWAIHAEKKNLRNSVKIACKKPISFIFRWTKFQCEIFIYELFFVRIHANRPRISPSFICIRN